MKKILLLLLTCLLSISFAIPASVFAEDESTEQHEHSWSEWYRTYEPTCSEEGIEQRYCYSCSEYEQRTIPINPNEHLWTEWYVSRKATVFRKGAKEKECFYCGETKYKETSKLKPFAKISKKSIKLKIGKKKRIKVRFANGDKVKKWRSSNSKVATVSKGIIKAKKRGTATISVKLKSGKIAKCKVRVTAPKKRRASSGHSHRAISSGGGTVYWTPSGGKYHVSRGCPTLNRSRTVYSGSISEAGGRTRCKVC